ncbi:hypothetical protein [Posidoniimonas polymericola]|uniref:hypothetical protein n=1 Tax=Posidoniimonas polymericola TaxID=2528002 RepID=UPI0011B852DF|nr:hypothetical protein [Posidoniimonas polymericola]
MDFWLIACCVRRQAHAVRLDPNSLCTNSRNLGREKIVASEIPEVEIGVGSFELIERDQFVRVGVVDFRDRSQQSDPVSAPILIAWMVSYSKALNPAFASLQHKLRLD